jgi:hypothetical protein
LEGYKYFHVFKINTTGIYNSKMPLVALSENNFMRTYKSWKQLNENFGGPIPIGLGRPSVVGGVMGSQEASMELDEAKKKKKKKMLGDEMPRKPLEGPEDELERKPGDEEEEELLDRKHGDEEEEEEEEKELGDEEELERKPGDEELSDELPAKKDLMMSKKKCNKSAKKSKKKMTKEEQDWYDSVTHQINSDPNRKYWDGFKQLEEDALIPPADPNAAVTEPHEPRPGEVGYAPVPRLGGWFANY